MTSMLSSLCCYGRRQRVSPDPAPTEPAAAPSRPGVLARLSGLATAARSGAQLGLAIGAAVTCGLTTKASYIAAMMAAGSTANKAVSTGIVLGSTVVVQSGVRTLVEGARCLGRERPALTPGSARAMKVLGVAAYLTAMLGSAYRAMQDEETQPLGAYMLSHAAGQVLSVLVAEWVANQLVPHAIVPIELLNGAGDRIDPASREARALRPAAEMALIAGQIVAHVALMAWMLDKIPWVQQALQHLGVPANRVIHARRHPRLRASQLLVPTRPSEFGVPGEPSLAWLRRFWLAAIAEPEPDTEAPTRIVLSRPLSQRRPLLQHQAWNASLAAQGFAALQPGLGVREQLRSLRRGERVVAAHGGAMVNLLLLPQGAEVLELANPAYAPPYFTSLIRSGGLRHRRVCGAATPAVLQQLLYAGPLEWPIDCPPP